MENASKALLMTGSILIGIILLSVAVYIYNIMTESKRMESSLLSEEQIASYNLEYTAFNKSRMYGTDVITVLNKARDNNEKYKDDDSYFIDIAFKLKDDVNVVTTKYTWNGKRFEASTQRIKATGNNKYQYDFVKNETYSLGNEENAKMIENFLNTSTDGTEIKDESHIANMNNPQKGEYYTITYTGFSDFKRMIFKCNSEKTKYNEVGKICYMEFEQVKSSTY